jgi:hypothetical protein
MLLTIAVAYGGRQEIIDAVQALLREQAKQGEDLDTRAVPLRARPGFLLWQSAYSEFYAGSTSCAPCARSSSAIAASGRSLPRNLRSVRLQLFAHVRDDGHPRRGDERQLKKLDPAHPRCRYPSPGCPRTET